MNQDIESQRLEAERLNNALQNTQDVLKRAIIEYRQELDEQKLVLENQGIKSFIQESNWINFEEHV